MTSDSKKKILLDDKLEFPDDWSEKQYDPPRATPEQLAQLSAVLVQKWRGSPELREERLRGMNQEEFRL